MKVKVSLGPESNAVFDWRDFIDESVESVESVDGTRECEGNDAMMLAAEVGPCMNVSRILDRARSFASRGWPSPGVR